MTEVSSFSDDVQKYTTFHNWGNPSEVVLESEPRTCLDVTCPSSGDHVLLKQMDQNRFHDRHCRWGKLYGCAMAGMGPGDMCVKTGPVSYEVNVDGQVWKCHADQLLSQFGSHYQLPNAHVPTDMDVRLLLLVDLPGSWLNKQPPIMLPWSYGGTRSHFSRTGSLWYWSSYDRARGPSLASTSGDLKSPDSNPYTSSCND